jgi:hypothetical protein
VLVEKEKRRLRVFENRVLRRYLDLRGIKEQENGGSCTVGSFIFFTHPKISLGTSNQGDCGGSDMWYAWERREKCTRFWWESTKGKYHLED